MKIKLGHNAKHLLVSVLGALLVATTLTAGPTSTPVAAASETPVYFHGSAGIMRGNSGTDVANHFITSSSFVFLTDDTTSWPGSDVSLHGIRVNNRGAGFFTVSTLDQSIAPTSGIPFNYLVVNGSAGTLQGMSFLAGRATVPAGTHNTGVNLSGVTSSSIIMLTVDATTITTSVLLPGLKINNKGSGFFTVTTLALDNAPSSGIPFNYLVLNTGFGTINAGRATIPSGVYNAGVNTQASNNPAGIFLTVDATSISGSDVALPGVKVNNHGAGFFTVTTTGLTLAPSTGVPFDWLVVEPPAKWEELGPTGTSGNPWTIQVDPANREIAYVGSSGGGVWKTTNGGQTWFPAWNQILFGIYRLAMQPGDHNTLYAMDQYGRIWVTHDAATTWTGLSVQPDVSDVSHSPMLVVTANGTLYVCTAGGLEQHIPTDTFWGHIEPGNDRLCTDIVVGADGTLYAAFRNTGVFRRLPGQGWTQIMVSFNAGNTVRIAVGSGHIVVDVEQFVFSNTLPVLGNWSPAGDFCGAGPNASQGGYAMSVAISPTDDNHFLAFGNCGRMTTDGGQTYFPDGVHNTNYLCPDPSGKLVLCPNLNVGQDDHQVGFWDDQHLYLATDNGPRFSNDGGVHWGQTTAGPSRITDGPPISEFKNLSVSSVDQFGRVFLAGNVQDHGATAMAGRNTGFRCCGGESGLTVGTAHPLNSNDTQTATFRYYGTDEVKSVRNVFLCTIGVPGPDYLAPSSYEKESDYPNPDQVPCPSVSVTRPDGSTTADFPASVDAIATSPERIDRALIGLGSGDVYRTTPGGNGVTFDRVLAHPEGLTVAANKIVFTSATSAYVGYEDGALYKITSPFGTPSSRLEYAGGSLGGGVVDIAGVGDIPSELYLAGRHLILKSTDDGASWSDVTGSGVLASNLQTVSIVGLAFDSAHPYLYVATGTGYPGTVFRSARPATGAWSAFDAGLPDGVPITGIGIAPDRALYISTLGRGVWWRRDVAAVPPNSGVNTPTSAMSRPGQQLTIVTTCSDPAGWHHIATLEFTLAMGHGAEDGNPVALRVAYDENRNVIRFFDPDRGNWSEGTPGSSAVLQSRYALLRLADTSVVGIGTDVPKTTVQINWAIQLNQPAAGDLQQWLRVTDDAGNATTWDRVGQWQVALRAR